MKLWCVDSLAHAIFLEAGDTEQDYLKRSKNTRSYGMIKDWLPHLLGVQLRNDKVDIVLLFSKENNENFY